MRIASFTRSGQTIHKVHIEPEDKEIYFRLACALLHAELQPGTYIPVRDPNLDSIFTADETQFSDFSRHMEAEDPIWDFRLGTSNNPINSFYLDDDPTSRGIKTPAVRQGKAELDAIFNESTRERKRGERAIKAHEPQRDIDRGGKTT